MKKKDIIVIAICAVVIIGSLLFILNGFSQKAPTTNVKSKSTIEFSGDIDKGTVEKIQGRKDYGTPNMDNIGRDNPFGSL